MTDLLPCPFCGGPARLITGESGGIANALNAEPPDFYALVACTNTEGCGVRGKTCGESFDSDPVTDAIFAWNRRAQPGQVALFGWAVKTRSDVEHLVRDERIASAYRKAGCSVFPLYPAPVGVAEERAFPQHIALDIQHNEHATAYEDVAEWIAHSDWCGWVSEEEKQRAIATNSVWTVRWYPDTPVGFCAIAASTLSAALEAALNGGEPE